ncbi:hypothetical protein E2C01_097060 [Portunus trituberculatus]|uniref:Uncharacterized protein n=1 Tax=Portunus trituberculatus TaxID=210409 RepID=A0A5B7K8I8_PORTR|nr:hypothetical protein [Portunus trituberculatus]
MWWMQDEGSTGRGRQAGTLSNRIKGTGYEGGGGGGGGGGESNTTDIELNSLPTNTTPHNSRCLMKTEDLSR